MSVAPIMEDVSMSVLTREARILAAVEVATNLQTIGDHAQVK